MGDSITDQALQRLRGKIKALGKLAESATGAVEKVQDRLTAASIDLSEKGIPNAPVCGIGAASSHQTVVDLGLVLYTKVPD